MARELRVAIIVSAILLVSIALAVDKQTNFSGTWVLSGVERSYSPSINGSGSNLPSGDGFPGGSPGAGGYPTGGGGGYPGGGGGMGGYPGGGGGYPGGGGGSRRGGGMPSGGGRRSGAPQEQGTPEDGQSLTLMISQTPDELKLERKRGSDPAIQPIVQTFTLDGKENLNADERGRGEYKSKTKWHKENLVIEGTLQGSGGSQSQDTKIKQELALSKDGQSLTVKISRTTPQGTATLKQTFVKQ